MPTSIGLHVIARGSSSKPSREWHVVRIVVFPYGTNSPSLGALPRVTRGSRVGAAWPSALFAERLRIPWIDGRPNDSASVRIQHHLRTPHRRLLTFDVSSA